MYTFERFLLSLWLLSYVLGDLLYYRVGSGNVYGPFPEQQLQEWVMAGYFGNDENLFVSATNQAESFQKYHDYIVPTQMERRQGVVGDANVRGMRKNFLRTAASFVKLDAKKLDRIKKFVVSATNKGIVAPRYTDFDKSAQYTSDVMYERKFDGPVPVAESIPIATKNDSEFAQKEKERESLISVLEDAAREEKFVSETGVKPAGESAPDGESDESLLQLIKRDNVEDAVKYPGKLKNSYVERRTSNTKQPKAIKVSVKSLPKVDNSLWDSEQDNAKAAAALRDEFLAELQQQTQTSGVRSVEQSDNHNFSRLSSSQGRARSRALRKLSILLWEIGRFLLSQFASLIPGPIRASSNYVAFLLRNASDRPVFMQLCGLFVLQVLRILLYIAAVPCTYDAIATFSGVASVVSRPIPSTTGMQVDGFEAAAAGSIVTSVLMEQLPSTFHTGQSSFPAQEPSDKVTLMHMLAAVLHYLRQFPHCFASPAVSYRMLLTFGSNINLRNIQAGLSHGGKTVRTIVAQFRHTPPAVLALSLVMFCIVMIDAVVVPWMQSSASLGYIAEPVDVACAGDDDESSGGVDADDADDLLDAAHIRKKHGACEPAWLLLSTDIVKPRVAAAPYVAYIQHVFAHTTQLIMWSWLACQIFPHLAVVLDTTGLLDAKVLCLPIGLVLVGGVVELYLTPSSEVATTTGTADIAAPNKEKSSALFHSSIARTVYLASVLSDTTAVEWCQRWQLLAYVAACLSREMALCGDILVRESASRTNAPNTPAVHQRTGAVRSFGTTLTLVVFASSMYACWSCFYKNERSHLLHDIHLSRLSRWVSDIASKTVSANPLLQFLATYLKHLLQGLVYLPLQAAKPTVDVRDSIIADQRPPPVFGNALFMCAAVLVAPNVLRIWQVSSLQRIRTQSHLLLGLAATTSFGSPLPLKTQQQPDPRRTAAEALLAGHRVLENLPFIASADDQAQRSTGWTAEGPDIMAGVEMNGVSIMHLGRVVLKDVSVKFPAGKIFVILSPEIGTGEAASSLLQQLSSQASQAVSGTIRVHGREVKDWNAAALHRRIAFLSVEENNFHLQAGALAGCLPGTSGAELRQALRAQLASGAQSVIAALPGGPACIVELRGNIPAGASSSSSSCALTSEQWRALHVSRALCHLGSPIVLLDQPTAHMSEAQESLFFAYLREHLRPDQVMVVTSKYLRTAVFADCVMQLTADGKVRDVADDLQQRLAGDGGDGGGDVGGGVDDAHSDGIMSKLKLLYSTPSTRTVHFK